MYSAAGQVLEAVEQKRGSVKSLAFSLPGGNGKKIYALVAETLKSWPATSEHFILCNSIIDPVLMLCAASILSSTCSTHYFQYQYNDRCAWNVSACTGYDVIAKTVAASSILEDSGSKVNGVSLCVCVCVCVCVRAYVRAYVRACMRVLFTVQSTSGNL